MSKTTRIFFNEDDLSAVLVGHQIVDAYREQGFGWLKLDDGTLIQIDEDQSDCCSYSDLTKITTTDNLITAVSLVDDDDPESGYRERARIQVVTESGIVDVAECITDPSSGYYLHGWSLGITVHHVSE
jgi:hypothetical protein